MTDPRFRVAGRALAEAEHPHWSPFDEQPLELQEEWVELGEKIVNEIDKTAEFETVEQLETAGRWGIVVDASGHPYVNDGSLELPWVSVITHIRRSSAKMMLPARQIFYPKANVTRAG